MHFFQEALIENRTNVSEPPVVLLRHVADILHNDNVDNDISAFCRLISWEGPPGNEHNDNNYG